MGALRITWALAVAGILALPGLRATASPAGIGALSPALTAASPAGRPCPPLSLDSLSIDFLGEALPSPEHGVRLQLVIGPDEGMGLVQDSLLLGTELLGAAPVVDDGWGTVAWEVGAGTGCVLRMLGGDVGTGDDSKTLLEHLALVTPELAITLTPERYECTWISEGDRSAIVECMDLFTQDGRGPLRAWLRLSWAGARSGSLPDWAVTLLGGASPTVDAGVPRMVRLPGEPFGPAPMETGLGVWLWDVAAGPAGWVAVGSERLTGWAEEFTDADAAVWTSPDGRTWARVGRGSEALGGDGEQSAWSVTWAGGAWWVIGSDAGALPSVTFRPVVWRSEDGRAWSRVAPGCEGATCPSPDGTLRLDQVTDVPGDLPLATGTVDGRPAWWRLRGTTLTGDGLLPGGEVPSGAAPLTLDVVSVGATGVLVLGSTTLEPPEGDEDAEDRPLTTAWWSPDLVAWQPLGGSAADVLAQRAWNSAVPWECGWLVAGRSGIALGDPDGWRLVRDAPYRADLLLHGDLLVAFGWNPPLASRDGLAWEPLAVEARPREPVGGFLPAASDGRTLVGIGGGADTPPTVWVLDGLLPGPSPTVPTGCETGGLTPTPSPPPATAATPGPTASPAVSHEPSGATVTPRPRPSPLAFASLAPLDPRLDVHEAPELEATLPHELLGATYSSMSTVGLEAPLFIEDAELAWPGLPAHVFIENLLSSTCREPRHVSFASALHRTPGAPALRIEALRVAGADPAQIAALLLPKPGQGALIDIFTYWSWEPVDVFGHPALRGSHPQSGEVLGYLYQVGDTVWLVASPGGGTDPVWLEEAVRLLPEPEKDSRTFGPPVEPAANGCGIDPGVIRTLHAMVGDATAQCLSSVRVLDGSGMYERLAWANGRTLLHHLCYHMGEGMGWVKAVRFVGATPEQVEQACAQELTEEGRVAVVEGKRLVLGAWYEACLASGDIYYWGMPEQLLTLP